MVIRLCLALAVVTLALPGQVIAAANSCAQFPDGSLSRTECERTLQQQERDKPAKPIVIDVDSPHDAQLRFEEAQARTVLQTVLDHNVQGISEAWGTSRIRRYRG